ncbi:MAG: zinc ribbon domain-containing protein [Pseudacidovorax sp.]|uniref:zinc ribbon domain-containing protein n=1 Tax=Pseudacidovorax sp. TaxID=1934311 RepID=UPI001B4C23FC|nr:zinc-ribbon domain-containing protein [Pseudacidovorax sp.]MBP6898041.1 zinc ribbon domain-containing protein [Pseudacidovorax sp.]
MALIDCPDCGRRVSPRAPSCPNCGAPITAKGRPADQRLVTPGLLGRLAAVLGAWLVFPWVARLLAFLAGIALLIVMFTTAR